ncbi:Hypothetical predicted protein [Pelobates cultripes]|uniref:Uncharacterized protein n=1 Tax=Pelobates cultripes TaxID=61616 RepID=A0AAD1RSD8_PELCU|nr:Hypothetical predicted protein [Pelobates cultripes]
MDKHFLAGGETSLDTGAFLEFMEMDRASTRAASPSEEELQRRLQAALSQYDGPFLTKGELDRSVGISGTMLLRSNLQQSLSVMVELEEYTTTPAEALALSQSAAGLCAQLAMTLELKSREINL